MKNRIYLSLMSAICFVLVLVLGFTHTVLADTFIITPIVAATQEYSDNILLTANNEETDYISTLTGGLKLSKETQRINTALSGTADKLFYWENDSLDSLDYQFSGNLNYNFTERFSSRISANYIKDSRRDRDAETTGLVVTGDRKYGNVNIGSNWQFSELQNADLILGYGRSETDQIEDANNGEDRDNFFIGFSLNRDLSEYFKSTMGTISLQYSFSETSTENFQPGSLLNTTTIRDYDTNFIELTAGISRDLTEAYNIFFFIGGTYSNTQEKTTVNFTNALGNSLGSVTTQDFEDDALNGVVSTGVTYHDEYYQVNVSLDHRMDDSTGTSGVVQRSSITGSISRRITEEFSLSLSASCILNQNERETVSDTDTLTFNVQPGIQYKFSPDFILTCSYRFTTIEDQEDNTNTKQNLVILTLRKEFEI